MAAEAADSTNLNCLFQYSLLKIKVDDGNFYIFTKNKKGCASFSVSLTDGKKSFSGEISESELRAFASSRINNMDFEVYSSLARKAFGFSKTINNSETKDEEDEDDECEFVYDVTSTSDGEMSLSWKQIISDDVKVMLGTIVLSETDTHDLMLQILDQSCKQLISFKDTLTATEAEKNRMKEDREKAVKLLDEFVTKKENMEKELYTKFVMVLNKKKDKINQLKQQIEALKDPKGNSSSFDEEEGEEKDSVEGNSNSKSQDLVTSEDMEFESEVPKQTCLGRRRRVVTARSQTSQPTTSQAKRKAYSSNINFVSDDTSSQDSQDLFDEI